MADTGDNGGVRMEPLASGGTPMVAAIDAAAPLAEEWARASSAPPWLLICSDGEPTEGGAESANYRWAVEAWATVIAPAMAAGASREDLEARDSARGAAPFRSLAIAYDLFVKDPILVSRDEGGSWSVTGGRHRLDAAKKAGLTHLPGKVLG